MFFSFDCIYIINSVFKQDIEVNFLFENIFIQSVICSNTHTASCQV